MQTRNPLLDDLARVASGALGVAAGMRREAEEMLRARFSTVMAGHDMVPREEFDAVKAMAAAAREENEALSARLGALEQRVEELSRRGGAAGGPQGGGTGA